MRCAGRIEVEAEAEGDGPACRGLVVSDREAGPIGNITDADAGPRRELEAKAFIFVVTTAWTRICYEHLFRFGPKA